MLYTNHSNPGGKYLHKKQLQPKIRNVNDKHTQKLPQIICSHINFATHQRSEGNLKTHFNSYEIMQSIALFCQ